MPDIGSVDRTPSTSRVGPSAGVSAGTAPVSSAAITQTAAVPPAQGSNQPAVQLSAMLARLIADGTIEALVIGRSQQGWPVVVADNGTFELAGAPALAINTRIELKLVEGGQHPRALIVRADGKPLMPPPEVGVEPGRVMPETPATSSAGPGLGRPLTATVVTSASPHSFAEIKSALAAGTLLSSGPAQLQPGTELVLIARQVVPPAAAKPAEGQPGPASSSVPPSAPPAPGPGLAPPAPVASPASGPPTTPTSTPAPRTVAATSAAPSAPPATSAHLLEGHVIGNNLNGHAVVRTPVGTLVLHLDQLLPPQTEIAFEVMETRLPRPAAPLPPESPAEVVMRLGRHWPALAEAIEILGATDDRLAKDALGRVIPQPGNRMASSALLFLSALRGGEIGDWLGEEPLKALEHAGRRDLVMRLTDDFQHLSRIARDDAGGDWRVLLVPVFDGHALQQATIYFRQRQRTKGRDTGEPAARFIVDLSLENLGSLQIDGLVHTKRLDLILRSARSMDGQWQRDIMAIFDDALAAIGLTGTIGFQAGQKASVTPLEEIRRTPPHYLAQV